MSIAGGEHPVKKFIPMKPEKEVISLRIDSSTLRELDRKAALFDISRNELLVQMIDYALTNMADPDPTPPTDAS